jgi:hypothetical protein
MDNTQRYVTDNLASTKVLQISDFWLSYALSTVEFIRIVAPKVAGSSPVGHPLICRKNVKVRFLTWLLVLQPYCNPLAEGFVQPFHGVVAYAPQEVRVAVHRLRDRGVPKQRLHYLGVHAPPKLLRGKGVAQAVEGEALIMQSCLLQQDLKLAMVKVAGVYRFTHTVGKD